MGKGQEGEASPSIRAIPPKELNGARGESSTATSEEQREEVEVMQLQEAVIVPEEKKKRFSARKLCMGVNSVFGRVPFYVRNNSNQIRTHKCHYVFGLLSCLMVVTSVTMLDSVLRKSPVVFLRLAEIENGEIDVRIESDGGMGFEGTLDYNIIKDRVKDPDQQFNTARMEIEGLSAVPLSYCPSGNLNDGSGVEWDFTNVAHRYQNMSLTLQSDELDWCETATDIPDSCLIRSCSPNKLQAPVTLFAIKSDREKTMELGRKWPLGPPAEGKVHIHLDLATSLGLKSGDQLFVSGQYHDYVRGALYNKTLDTSSQISVPRQSGIIHILVTVDQTFDKVYGKFPEGQSDAVIMNYDEIFEKLADNMDPDFPTVAQELREEDPNQYATAVLFNLPPAIRLNTYLGIDDFTATGGSDFDKVQKALVGFASEIMFDIGYSQVDTSLAIMISMRLFYFFSLFLGLILSIIIAILSLLSTMLIYSLLMINVETRTFELGVLRMVGLRRWYLIELLIVQALLFAIPAWMLGVGIAQFFMIFIVDYISGVVDTDMEIWITWQSFLLATSIGIGIPLLSSIVPIRNALSQNVNDALDTSRSKTVGVKYNIERSGGAKLNPAVFAVGAGMAVFGFMIYYLFPLSLLTLNVPLLLNIFFGLLLGMLFGAVILSLNFERIVENILVTAFLSWWNNRAIINVVHKNLTAHRIRNRKTTVMFSLSLGFVIFIAVSSTVQIDSFAYQLRQSFGAENYIMADISSEGDKTVLYRNRVEIERMLDESGIVENFGWFSDDLDQALGFSRSHVATLARIEDDPVNIVGMSPMGFESTFRGFLRIAEQDLTQTLNLGEQLYSAVGSYMGLLGSYYCKFLNLERGEPYVTETRKEAEGSKIRVHMMEPLAFLHAAPLFQLSRFLGDQTQNQMVSLPVYVTLADGEISSVEEIPFKYVLIRYKPDALDSEKSELRNKLGDYFASESSVTIENVGDVLESLEVAVAVLGVFFGFVTVIAMCLSFFSLVSAMYTNIKEQVKEIGVMRAIGFNKNFITKVYVMEAFIVVLCSSSLGVAIGTLVGWSMVAQRALFTQLPIPFKFPYAIIGAVFLAAVFFAIGASCSPIRLLLRNNIVKILRMTS